MNLKKVFQNVWNAPTGAHAHQIKTLQRQVIQLVDELNTTRILYARECERSLAAEKFIVDVARRADRHVTKAVESVALPRPYAGETVGQYSEYVYALNRPAMSSAASSVASIHAGQHGWLTDDNESVADDNESAAG